MYYKDTRFTKPIFSGNNPRDGSVDAASLDNHSMMKYQSVRGFRDKPAVGSVPIINASIDPNAWFLAKTSSQRGGTILDNGHPFEKVEHWSDFDHFVSLYKVPNLSNPSSLRYGGPIVPGRAWQYPAGNLLFPLKSVAIGADRVPVYSNPTNRQVQGSYPAFPPDDLLAIGQEYFSQVALNAPAWSGLTSLSELREGLPRLPGHFLNGAARTEIASQRNLFKTKIWLKKGGGELTNINFGWLPLVQDIMAFAKALAYVDYQLNELERNSGKPIRRRRSTAWTVTKEIYPNLATISGNTERATANPGFLFEKQGKQSSSSAHSVALGTIPSARLELTDSRRDWYSASFSYRYLPPARSRTTRDPRFNEKVRYLFRPDLTLGQFYAAAPWSWLVDWFVDLSSTLLSNQLIADVNLIQNYGYVMAERERRATLTVDPGSYNIQPNWQPVIPTLRLTHGTTMKQRIRGNPFGFNVRLDNLTIRQLGILAGLGLAKL